MKAMQRETAYLRLYREIREEILRGLRPYGEKLPSKRVTAEAYGLSLATVQHAYEILCDEGYVNARERSGYYVAYHPAEVLMEASVPELPVRTHHGTNPDEALSPGVYARLMRRVLSEYGGRVLLRSPNNGCPELREALAAYLAVNRGIGIPADRIVIGSGAEYLYGQIVQLLGRDRVYAHEDPCYERIRQVYAAQGVRCDALRMGEDGIRSEALAVTKASVLHVTPFHSWPTGITASASKRREYIRWAQERQAIIIEDDFDSEFSASTKTEDTLFAQDREGRVIYLNTFSKTVAPGIRVGYMALPESLAERYRRELGFYSCTVPVAEQLLLAELIRSGEFVRHINRIRRRRRQRGRQKENRREEP